MQRLLLIFILTPVICISQNKLDYVTNLRLKCLARSYYIISTRYSNAYYKGLSDSVINKMVLDEMNKAGYYLEEDAYGMYRKADIEYRLSMFSDAVSDFTQSIKMQTNTGAYEEKYLMTISIKDKDTIWNIDSNYTGYFILGDDYLLRGKCKEALKDYRGGISDFNRVIDISKLHKNLLFYDFSCSMKSNYKYKALCEYELGQYSIAKQDFYIAIHTDKDYGENGEMYYNLAVCNFKLGEKEKACMNWSKSGELGFKDAYQAIADNCQNNGK